VAGFAGSAWSKHLSWVRRRRSIAVGVVAVVRDARETITGPLRRIQCVWFESRGSFQLVPRSGKGQAEQKAS
jgi:hypothetical protein